MSFKLTPQKIIALLFVFIVFYLTIYTWNSRTQTLDRLASYSGLEVVGWILKPGKWIQARSLDFWGSYIHLVEVHSENQTLKQEIKQLRLKLADLSEKAAAVPRLQELLDFAVPDQWSKSGARIIAHNFGPLGAIDSVIIDKGKFQGVSPNLPVVTPTGVMGRTFRTGLNFSSVLLLTDPNSRIPVISSESRVKGILSGQGTREPLLLKYVHLNSPLKKGEVLVTSGLAGIYPKGLPVATVRDIFRSEISLFLIIEATPLVDFRNKEEVLVMQNGSRIKDGKIGFGNE
ncbi:MAG: rod shape-determining protein MreC [Desulfonatronovibrio sp.]